MTCHQIRRQLEQTLHVVCTERSMGGVMARVKQTARKRPDMWMRMAVMQPVAKKERKVYTCSNCGKSGHNKRSCTHQKM